MYYYTFQLLLSKIHPSIQKYFCPDVQKIISKHSIKTIIKLILFFWEITFSCFNYKAKTDNGDYLLLKH